MRFNHAGIALLFLVLNLWTVAANVAAATSPSADSTTAKKQAEAKGYMFVSSHDEIIAKAKKEGKLRVLSSYDRDTFQELRKAFIKQYPFIDLSIQRSEGVEAFQRFLLELQAARRSNWDVVEVATELYKEFLPYSKKLDIFAMAKQGVLQIPAEIIDPVNRNIVSLASTIHCVAYNKNLIAPEKVPHSWEDFLKPEFKGRKFMTEVRPQGFTPIAAARGEEWAVNYARKIKDQEPIWVRGTTRGLMAVMTGEQTLYHLPYYHSCIREKRKDVSKSMECKIIEPVPIRIQEMTGILESSPYAHAALLWLEFQISPAGQAIIESVEPKSSPYIPGSEAAKVTRGKKLWVNNWETFQNSAKWQQMVVEAFGLPQASLK
jgi:ABC-type Fe3+ transport system substrate-binding protein